MVIRCVLADGELDLSGLDRGVEVRSLTAILEPAPWVAHEVLVVSAEPAVLAEAGALGLNRLGVTDPGPTTAAVLELCRELDRPDPSRAG